MMIKSGKMPSNVKATCFALRKCSSVIDFMNASQGGPRNSLLTKFRWTTLSRKLAMVRKLLDVTSIETQTQLVGMIK